MNCFFKTEMNINHKDIRSRLTEYINLMNGKPKKVYEPALCWTHFPDVSSQFWLTAQTNTVGISQVAQLSFKMTRVLCGTVI